MPVRPEAKRLQPLAGDVGGLALLYPPGVTPAALRCRLSLNETRQQETVMEQRLTDMEMLIMHQGRIIEQLNEVVTGQQACIDQLVKELKIIKEHLRGLSSDNRSPSEEEPPPHY